MAVLVALAFPPAGTAADPADVYNDFARDRVLSCRYSRAELNAALADATLAQYGDPYTLIGLKAAVRKQLATGCGSRAAAPASSGEGAISDADRGLALAAGLLVAIVGAGGWAARRALTREQ